MYGILLVIGIPCGIGALIAGGILLRRSIVSPFRDELDPVRRVAIAQKMGAIKDKKGLRHLIRAMKEDPDPRVRAATACAAGEIGDMATVPALVQKAGDNNESLDVRICSMKSLRILKDHRSLDPLLLMLETTTGNIRIEVIQTIRAFNDSAALKPLVALLTPLSQKLEYEHEYDITVKAVAELGEPAVEAARQLYRNGREGIAISIMQEVGEPASGDLLAIFRSGSQASRYRAARALLLSRSSSGREGLRVHLQTDIRLVAQAHLDLIELGDESFLPLLTHALAASGNKQMAVNFLNCGHSTLEAAARQWAREHGYQEFTSSGFNSAARWGRR